MLVKGLWALTLQRLTQDDNVTNNLKYLQGVSFIYSKLSITGFPPFLQCNNYTELKVNVLQSECM